MFDFRRGVSWHPTWNFLLFLAYRVRPVLSRLFPDILRAFPAHARHSGLVLENALETARGHNSPRVEEMATDSWDMHIFSFVQLKNRLSVYRY